MSNPINKSVSVIIPTLDAEKYLPDILSALETQSYPVSEIIIVDSASSDKTVSICESNQNVKLIQIKREDFDHGKTRDMALRESSGDIVIFMTQDAIPTDKSFIGNLIEPLHDPKMAVSVGRQVPKQNAEKTEKLVRNFNYPPESYIRSEADISSMGIKAFFSSNSCAAYRKDIYMKLGGFDYPVKTNEDMFYAAKALHSGYCVAYTAGAQVYHSHNFTLKEQYRRNYLQGYEIERHRELLDCELFPEGMKLVQYVSCELLKDRDIASLVGFGFDCCARFLGNKAGIKAYRKEQRTHDGNK